MYQHGRLGIVEFCGIRIRLCEDRQLSMENEVYLFVCFYLMYCFRIYCG